MFGINFFVNGESTGRGSTWPFIPTKGMHITFSQYNYDTSSHDATECRVTGVLINAKKQVFSREGEEERFNLKDPSISVYLETVEV